MAERNRNLTLAPLKFDEAVADLLKVAPESRQDRGSSALDKAQTKHGRELAAARKRVKRKR